MTFLFADARIVDFILPLVVLEALVLILYHRATGKGIAAADLIPNLLAGAALLAAVRFAAMHAWLLLAAALACALLAHGFDLARRWGR